MLFLKFALHHHLFALLVKDLLHGMISIGRLSSLIICSGMRLNSPKLHLLLPLDFITLSLLRIILDLLIPELLVHILQGLYLVPLLFVFNMEALDLIMELLLLLDGFIHLLL